MARNRMITPEFWLDEDLAKLTPHARLLYIGLWAICDDNYATLPNRPEWIKVQIFPYEEIEIKKILDELSRVGKIIPFKADDNKEYFWIKNFFKYQTIDRPSKPKYPEYKPNTKTLDEYSTNTRPKDKISKVNTTTKVVMDFNSDNYIKSLINSKQEHIKIIGHYMEIKKMRFPSEKAAKAELGRSLKSAVELAEYPKDKRTKAVQMAAKQTNQWTLLTVVKYLNK